MKPDFQVDGVSLQSLIHNLKLKKSFKFGWLPIECMASATFNIEHHKFTYKLGCRDRLLGGKISLNTTQKSLDYCKKLPFPLFRRTIGRMGWLVIGGRLTMDPISPHLGGHLSYHLGFEVGGQGCSLASPTALRITPCAFLGRIGIEAISQVEVTLPSSFMFEQGKGRWPRLGRSKSEGEGALRVAPGRVGDEEDDEEGFGLKLSIGEMNVIINL